MSGLLAFIASWFWLLININQPNYVSSDTIDEHQRINTIQYTLTIIWLVATLLATLLSMIIIKNRGISQTIIENPNNYGKLIFLAVALVVINPHFSYVFIVIMLDIIFRGV